VDNKFTGGYDIPNLKLTILLEVSSMRLQMRLSCLGLSLALLLLAAGQTLAQGISYTYVTDASSYTGTVGGTVAVNIYLQENNASSSLITAAGGLSAAGAGLWTNAVNGSSVNSFTQASGFPLPFGASPQLNQAGTGTSSLEFSEVIGSGASGVGLGTGVNANRVYLGQAILTVGSGTTTYDLSSLTNDFNNSSYDGNQVLGGLGSDTTVGKSNPSTYAFDTGTSAFTGADAAPNYTFTVGPATAVPEPSSVILTGMAGALFVFGAWHRRRRIARDNSESAAPVLALA
jgi:hypothetical protein